MQPSVLLKYILSFLFLFSFFFFRLERLLLSLSPDVNLFAWVLRCWYLNLDSIVWAYVEWLGSLGLFILRCEVYILPFLPALCLLRHPPPPIIWEITAAVHILFGDLLGGKLTRAANQMLLVRSPPQSVLEIWSSSCLAIQRNWLVNCDTQSDIFVQRRRLWGLETAIKSSVNFIFLHHFLAFQFLHPKCVSHD